MSKYFIKPTEDTVWSNPYTVNEIGWIMRYGSKEEKLKWSMTAASVISSYIYLFSMSQKERNKIIELIKKAHSENS